MMLPFTVISVCHGNVKPYEQEPHPEFARQLQKFYGQQDVSSNGAFFAGQLKQGRGDFLNE
jgi:hypothetical protein